MKIYCGKESGTSSKTIENTVQRICSELELKGNKTYLQNFYTSPKFFDLLPSKMIIYSGTLKRNRKNIPETLKIQENA